MSALDMLDVAIGIIFIYMLLSIICTAIIEIIEAWLKKRASDLERGIRELLSDPNGVSLAGQLYAHPLISGLYRGTASGPKMKLPAYIPARTFALALMDVILPAKPGIPSGASGAANTTSLGVRATSLQINARAAAAAQSIVALRAAIVAQPIGALATTSASQALLTLVDSAGDDMSKVRENIEGWYNNSMDRVAGWYKRRAQKISLFLGLLIAVVMNIDSIAVLRSLSNDDVLRSTVVAAAAEYAKSGNQPKPKTDANSTLSVRSLPPDSNAETNLGAADTTATSNTEVDSITSQDSSTTSISDSTESKVETPQQRIEEAMKQLQELRLPIGWDWRDATQTAKDTAKSSRKKIKSIKDKSHPSYATALATLHSAIQDSTAIADQASKVTNRNLAIPHGWGWLSKVFGWLITGMAVSLGAPFWFDLLNKVMVIRSTVKPHEKSLEEASEDRQR